MSERPFIEVGIIDKYKVKKNLKSSELREIAPLLDKTNAEGTSTEGKLEIQKKVVELVAVESINWDDIYLEDELEIINQVFERLNPKKG